MTSTQSEFDMKFDYQARKFGYKSEKHQNIEHLAAEMPCWIDIAESKLDGGGSY